MALRVSAATMALCLLFSLMAVAHCVVPLEAGLATNDASSIGTPVAVTVADPGVVDAVPDEQGLLSLPSADESAVPARDGEVPGEEEAVKPVAEPDPDRSHPDGEEEEKKTKKNHDADGEEEEEEKKRKKHHACGDKKGKKEKKTKKHHQSDGDEEDEEEETKKKIHRHHHHAQEEKALKKQRPHHDKKSSDGNDSDDEDEVEKKAKRWRKAARRSSMFGHGRRSQREESQTQEVKN